MGEKNMFHARKQFELEGKTYNYYQLKALTEADEEKISRLPFSIRVLLESLIRQYDGHVIKDEHVQGLLNWGTKDGNTDVPFKPSRVILQDFTGVPAVVDLASLRKAMVDMGGDPAKINPEVPVDLRSEEHTSELQSRFDLVCRLLLEKK